MDCFKNIRGIVVLSTMSNVTSPMISDILFCIMLLVSTLKIDKVFVDELQVPGNRLLLAEIITVGKGMGMTIIAEGIEQPEQPAFLKAHVRRARVFR